MAAFDPAYQRTCANEGGYANRPADAGGETYRGISRRWHPEWDGWALVDWWRTWIVLFLIIVGYIFVKSRTALLSSVISGIRGKL